MICIVRLSSVLFIRRDSTNLLSVCPESIDAIQGALGTVCEAVDRVIGRPQDGDSVRAIDRAFVAIRPPGHHCGEDTPSGFCFVNNVAVAAAHGVYVLEIDRILCLIFGRQAIISHNIKRIVIFDIDLHHGAFTSLAGDSLLMPC